MRFSGRAAPGLSGREDSLQREPAAGRGARTTAAPPRQVSCASLALGKLFLSLHGVTRWGPSRPGPQGSVRCVARGSSTRGMQPTPVSRTCAGRTAQRTSPFSCPAQRPPGGQGQAAPGVGQVTGPATPRQRCLRTVRRVLGWPLVQGPACLSRGMHLAAAEPQGSAEGGGPSGLPWGCESLSQDMALAPLTPGQAPARQTAGPCITSRGGLHQAAPRGHGEDSVSHVRVSSPGLGTATNTREPSRRARGPGGCLGATHKSGLDPCLLGLREWSRVTGFLLHQRTSDGPLPVPGSRRAGREQAGAEREPCPPTLADPVALVACSLFQPVSGGL